MNYLETIEFPGINQVIDNANFYKEKFLQDSVIVFRNANLTYEEQSFLHKELKKYFGYNIKEDAVKNVSKYIENHSGNSKINLVSGNEVMLQWHIEHTYFVNPIVFASWNMIKFNTDKENGKTYFVDSQELYNQMPIEWQDFLNSCLIGPNDNQKIDHINNYLPVSKHWLNENPVIRMAIAPVVDGINNLISVNEKNATKEDQKLFNEISLWFGNNVCKNEDIRMVHRWQQGDLVMPDIFKLAHSVTGGFKSEDREFIGMWGYKN
jgi:alpha-ketoglutarate-dependent taurine dioxygenase